MQDSVEQVSSYLHVFNSELYFIQIDEEYIPESPIPEVEEDLPSDDGMSPEDSPRRKVNLSQPAMKPNDTIVLEFGGGQPSNRSNFFPLNLYLISTQFFSLTCKHNEILISFKIVFFLSTLKRRKNLKQVSSSLWQLKNYFKVLCFKL